MQSSSDAPRKLAIADIRCDGLPQGKSKSSSKHYLVFSITGTKKKQKTGTAHNQSNTWNDVLYLDVPDSKSKTVLHIKVYAKHRLQRDELISEVDLDISSVTSQQGEKKSITTPIVSKSSGETASSLTFTIYQATTSDVVAKVNEIVPRMNDGPSFDGIDKATDDTTKAEALLTPFAALVENLSVFVSVVDKLSEIHPYAKCAWTVLSAAYKVIEAQKDLDDSVKELVDVLNDAYLFVQEAEPLERKAFGRLPTVPLYQPSSLKSRCPSSML